MTLPPFPARAANVERLVRHGLFLAFGNQASMLNGDTPLLNLDMAELAREICEMVNIDLSDVSPFPQTIAGWRDLICAKLADGAA